ncbi:MAG: protein kinase [Planctomycetota bacterium]|nr:protein kinase [Planctomycetota bacterium]
MVEQTIISDAFSASVEISPKAETRPTDQFSAPLSNAEHGRFLPGTLFANRYRIVSLLGRGGMGEVYRADDLTLDQPVALKFLPQATTVDAAAIQRIRHEARLARRVTHPNVCRVHDIGEWAGDHFLSMEIIEGEDLAVLLRRIGSLPREMAFEVCRQVAAGVAAAHARGVLHRDLKPGNILIDSQGRVVITDFGLALPSEQALKQRSSVGTLPYMSPEQVLGQGINERSDLYSLGLVIHDAFTGKRVFRANTGEELLKLRRTTFSVEGRLSPDLEPAVRELIERCLAFEPADRPKSALEIHEALYRAESPQGVAVATSVVTPLNNIPPQLTSFIGRERERGEVRKLLGQNRLVTLVGPGGAGKTRLSLQVATEELDQYGDGVWMVELAPLADPALVPQTIASVLGIREAGGRPIQETLAEQLGGKRLLIVLDNCEHVVAACATVANLLLKRCPAVKILASSRERLGVPGEATFQIPSLSLPTGAPPATAASALGYEAVALFVDRAKSAGSRFELTDANAAVAARICRRLDGIPLALELAAARTRSLTLEDLERRLDDCFRILTGGSKTLLPRQQTLRALIDWSYDLLSENERLLFSRLSVFAGGFSLAAVEQVCAGGGIDEFEILDLMTSLADQICGNRGSPVGRSGGGHLG